MYVCGGVRGTRCRGVRCAGATTLPVTSMTYDAGDMPLMYRAYNGQVNGRGRVTTALKRPPLHRGDNIRFEWNGTDGTLSVIVNGTSQGIVWRGLQSAGTLYPAMCFCECSQACSPLLACSVPLCARVSADPPLVAVVRVVSAQTAPAAPPPSPPARPSPLSPPSPRVWWRRWRVCLVSALLTHRATWLCPTTITPSPPRHPPTPWPWCPPDSAPAVQCGSSR